MSETFAEQVSRVRLMASGDETWDLTPNDIAALKAVLAALDKRPVAPPLTAGPVAPPPDDVKAEVSKRLRAAEGRIRSRQEFWGNERYRHYLEMEPDWRTDEADVEFYRALLKALGEAPRGAARPPQLQEIDHGTGLALPALRETDREGDTDTDRQGDDMADSASSPPTRQPAGRQHQ